MIKMTEEDTEGEEETVDRDHHLTAIEEENIKKDIEAEATVASETAATREIRKVRMC